MVAACKNKWTSNYKSKFCITATHLASECVWKISEALSWLHSTFCLVGASLTWFAAVHSDVICKFNQSSIRLLLLIWHQEKLHFYRCVPAVTTFAWQLFGMSSRTSHSRKTFASVSLQRGVTARNADFLVEHIWTSCWTFKSTAFQPKTKSFTQLRELTNVYVWLGSRILLTPAVCAYLIVK